MGLINEPRSGAPTTFVSIRYDKLAVKVEKGTEGAEAVTSVDGERTNYYLFYNALSGTLVDMYTREVEFNKTKTTEFIASFVDGQNRFQLTFDVESDWFMSFVKFITSPTIDIKKPVKIQVSRKEDGEKIYKTVFISQGEVNAKAAWTRDSAEQPPRWVKHEVGKKVIWDKQDQVNWLMNRMNELHAKLETGVAAAVVSKPSDFGDTPAEDDLPF